MKTHALFAVAAAALLVLFSSCSSGPVTRVSADTQVDLSGRWNDTDVRQVCESLISGCLNAPSVDRFITTYSSGHRGELPTVLVGNFRNTSSEHIDTTIISGIMRTAIINSGKLEFVEGGDLREDLRAERQDQQTNASEATVSTLANETGATFMLNGTVRAIVDRNGNTSVRSYFVTASLTNIETNRILWEGENNEIKKVINQAKVKL